MPKLILDEFTIAVDCDKTRYIFRKNKLSLCGHYGCKTKIDLDLPFQYCDKHRFGHRDEQKKLVDARVAAGLCVVCKEPVSKTNKRLCERHRVLEVERKRKVWK